MACNHLHIFFSNLVSVVRGKLYLFGGWSCPDAAECLPGVYSFDIGEDVQRAGWAPSTTFAPFFQLTALQPLALTCTDGLSAPSTVSLTWDCSAVSGVALRTLRHSSVAVGDNIYVYGGLLEGRPTNDLMVFNTGQG